MEHPSYGPDLGPDTAEAVMPGCSRVFGVGSTFVRCELTAGHESGHCAPLPPGLSYHHVVWLPGDPRERDEVDPAGS